jgi:hypothetical protein
MTMRESKWTAGRSREAPKQPPPPPPTAKTTNSAQDSSFFVLADIGTGFNRMSDASLHSGRHGRRPGPLVGQTPTDWDGRRQTSEDGEAPHRVPVKVVTRGTDSPLTGRGLTLDKATCNPISDAGKRMADISAKPHSDRCGGWGVGATVTYIPPIFVTCPQAKAAQSVQLLGHGVEVSGLARRPLQPLTECR